MARYLWLTLLIFSCGGAQHVSQKSDDTLDRLAEAPTFVAHTNLRSLKDSSYIKSWERFVGVLIADVEKGTLTSGQGQGAMAKAASAAAVWQELKDGWSATDDMLVAVRYVDRVGPGADSNSFYNPNEDSAAPKIEVVPDPESDAAEGAYVPPENISHPFGSQEIQAPIRGELPFRALVQLSGNYEALLSRLPDLMARADIKNDAFEFLPDGSLIFSDDKLSLSVKPSEILCQTRGFLLEKTPSQPALSPELRALLSRHQSSIYLSQELGLFDELNNIPFEGPMREALGNDVADLYARQAYYYQELDYLWLGVTFSDEIKSDALLAFRNEASAKGFHGLLEQTRELQRKDLFYIVLGGDIIADEWTSSLSSKNVTMSMQLSGEKLERFTGRMEMLAAELALAAKIGIRYSGALGNYIDESEDAVPGMIGPPSDTPIIEEGPSDTPVIEE